MTFKYVEGALGRNVPDLRVSGANGYAGCGDKCAGEDTNSPSMSACCGNKTESKVGRGK
jgi:hypothetical protein